MEPNREQTLRVLADTLARQRLLTPARLALDVIEPVSFLASQVALFVRPLVPHSRWRTYVAALAEQDSWQVLRSMMDQRES